MGLDETADSRLQPDRNGVNEASGVEMYNAVRGTNFQSDIPESR